MEIKKFLLFSIVPALIAGLFSVAPLIYERAVEPKANLTFTLVEGPQIRVDDELQQVISITVKNDGSKPLNMVTLNINIPSGTVQSYSEANPSGLSIGTRSDKEATITSAPRMLEGETFSVTLLVKSQETSTNIKPVIKLRSDEVLGKQEWAAEKTTLTSGAAALGGALTAISVFIMSIAFQVMGLVSNGGKAREDMIFYIAMATNTEHLIERYSNKITYLRFAELLLKHGCTAKEYPSKTKNNCISALKCMLLLEKNSSSDKIILRNIKLLEKSEDPDLDKKLKKIGKEAKEAADLRDQIDKLLSTNFQFS